MENMLYGLKVTAIGMGIVFAALYFLQLVMHAFRLIFYESKQKVASPPVPEAAPQEEPEVEGLAPAVVAVISAAVAYCLGGRPVNIVSIRREGETKTAWQQVARANAVARKSN